MISDYNTNQYHNHGTSALNVDVYSFFTATAMAVFFLPSNQQN